MPSTRSRLKGAASASPSSWSETSPPAAAKKRSKPTSTSAARATSPSSRTRTATTSSASKSKTKRRSPPYASPNAPRKTPFLPLFAVIAAARLFSALTNIIHDCDEVYNYWEPLHYALFGSGMQTWEYSSGFALRPWLYLALHGLVAAPAAAASRAVLGMGFGDSKRVAFYAVRVALAMASAAAEASLATAAGDVLCGRGRERKRNNESFRSPAPPLVSVALALLLATSAGMFSSSPALLPSSFVMVFLTAAAARVLRGEQATAVVACGVFGLLWGWPVAAVAFLPYALWVLSCSGDVASLLRVTGVASALAALALAPLVALDRVAYGKWTLSLLNFLRYNVSGDGGDSSLYGVEEWHYYLRNSVLNLGLVAVLAVAAPVALALAALGERAAKGGSEGAGDDEATSSLSLSPSALKRLAITLAPLPLWSVVISALPHKEERFLYPVYPLACLAAAATVAAAPAAVAAVASLPLRTIRKLFGSFSPSSSKPVSSRRGRARSSSGAAPSPKNPSSPRSRRSAALLLQASLVVAASAAGCSRVAALLSCYSAPLRIYSRLPRDPEIAGVPAAPPPSAEGDDGGGDRTTEGTSRGRSLVCVGAEWHRFPSSFLLPGESYRLAFVPSGFEGLLPVPFASPNDEVGGGRWQGTRAAPPSLNDRNERDERNELADDAPCDWFVGLAPPLGDAGREPHGDEWERVASLPFLDVNAPAVRALPAMARAFYLPRWFAERVLRRPSWAATAEAGGGGGGLLSHRGQYVLMKRKRGTDT